ncbi:RDD family protein [Haloferula sargassicola]|uniref:RDD domain-containing protein n=1 Tax=Haloferula sargassicola TaxID=490096 RepID=A0ABP9US54_9BACT
MADDEKKPDLPKPDLPPPSLSKPPKAPPVETTPPPMPPGDTPPPAGSAPPKVIQDVELDEDEVVEPGGIPPINTRLIAAVIDCIVATGLFFAVAQVWGKLSYPAWVAYMMFRDSLPFLPQGGVGKMAMKLRVEKTTGGSITGDWAAGAVRNILMVLPFFGPLVEAIILFTRENQPAQRGLRLGDEWAKTRVVVAPVAPVEPPAA